MPAAPGPRTETRIKVADEVWIATALLHREQPQHADFSVDEIVERAQRERLTPELRPGVRVHANLHCVANLPPNPGRYRMLYATAKSRRRLFRPDDTFHPARDRSKTTPDRSEISRKYWDLLDWYEADYSVKPARGGGRTSASRPSDPLLGLRGSGRELWADEHADDYVRRLRNTWR
jgi:hypothetical protein